MLMPVMIIWSAVTVVLIGLSIYRSILVFYEDDQIFLNPSGAAMASEFAAMLRRIKHLESILKAFTAASGSLLLLVATIWVYQGLFR